MKKDIQSIIKEISSREYVCTECGRVGHYADFSIMSPNGSGVCELCCDFNQLRILDKDLRSQILEYYFQFDRSCSVDICIAKHCLFCNKFWQRIEQDKGITVHRT